MLSRPAFRFTRLCQSSLLTLTLLSGAALATAADGPDTNTHDAVIARVNGIPLSSEGFKSFINTRLADSKPGQLNQKQLQHLLNEFINRELIYQDGLKHDLEKSPAVINTLANQKRNIIASYRVRQIVSNPPDQKTLEELYRQQFSQPVIEYKLRHILLKDEETARQLIAQLDLGESFTDLANEHSRDTSASNGGELAWITADQMPQAFQQAITELQPGEYTGNPVKSSYGWHIIQLDRTREVPPPPFEKVRDELLTQWQQQQLSQYLNSLRENARVEIKQP